MQKDRSHLPAWGTSKKFDVGLTRPRPGPTFPRVVATAEKELMRSSPMKARHKVATMAVDM